MPTFNGGSPAQPSLIDDFLPASEFNATYEIVVDAPAPVVYDCLLHTDLSDIWLLRLLMAIRTGKLLPRNRTPGDLRQRFHGTGFVILGESSERRARHRGRGAILASRRWALHGS
jgi:hypothetical protein